jgi:hypothetical protein
MDFDRLEDLEDTGPDWSVSRLHTMLSCGKKYEYKYILKVHEPPTPPLAFGSAIHSCLEQIQFTDQWDDSYVQRLWGDEWYEAQRHIDWDATMYRKSTYDKKGPNILESFIKWHQDDQWLALETRFRYSPGKGYPTIRGTWDKIQRLTEHPDVPSEYVGRLAIIDYKTGKNPPDKDLISVDPQLSIYHEAFKEMFNEDVVMGLHHLPTDTIYWTTRNDKSIDVVYEMLGDALHRNQSGEFGRNIDYQCKWCPFKEQCFKELKDGTTD